MAAVIAPLADVLAYFVSSGLAAQPCGNTLIIVGEHPPPSPRDTRSTEPDPAALPRRGSRASNSLAVPHAPETASPCRRSSAHLTPAFLPQAPALRRLAAVHSLAPGVLEIFRD